ncbi:Trehalose-6-P synthase/phosphatase complex subunit [Polyrhizophydium stewartii]|uniref:Trehalose-6-P synthase/phosphatase complex subunit n=1 Tax=Polyrhizophydium stewartii TaxID=2732419 RepID=A0ABR4NDM9_9FUNG
MSFVSALSAGAARRAAAPLLPSAAGNVALQNAVRAGGGLAADVLWVGALAADTDPLPAAARAALAARLRADHACAPVFVAAAELDGHYNHFCKKILWKPFHYQLPDYQRSEGFTAAAWAHYVTVNQRFADTIAEVYRPGDVGTFPLAPPRATAARRPAPPR